MGKKVTEVGLRVRKAVAEAETFYGQRKKEESLRIRQLPLEEDSKDKMGQLSLVVWVRSCWMQEDELCNS